MNSFGNLLQQLVTKQFGQGTPDLNGVGMHQGPFYTEPGLVSTGGAIQPINSLPALGGTIGIDHGQPFGSANINGNVIGQFGPQGNDVPVNPGGMPMMAYDALRLLSQKLIR